MRNPLLDVAFLEELYHYSEREVFARLTLLDFQNAPLEEIQGRVTQGSLSINGSSAVRSTCTLTLITSDMDINAFHWGLRSKFRLEIGLKNFINNLYPPIIWFPKGIFIITQLSTAQSLNNFTLSIQGQDKMCLLNGTLGGNLTSSIDFGVSTFYDIENDMVIKTENKIKNIIQTLLQHYAQEPIQNIIINDIDDYGIELLEYRADVPMYLFKRYLSGLNSENNYFDNMSIDDSQTIYIGNVENGEEEIAVTLSEFGNRYIFDSLNSQVNDEPTIIYLQPFVMNRRRSAYTVVRIEKGETAGYRTTEVTYPGDLICSIGETITSVLDKLKKVLGNFEYFYDEEGRFIFQKQRTFVDVGWNTISSSDEYKYIDANTYNSSYTFSFENGKLITSFNNNPNIANLKNDYAVWGNRRGVAGARIPIHMRYAIMPKPDLYNSISVSDDDAASIGLTSGQVGKRYSVEDWDWRELLYQMASDYFKFGQLDDFKLRVREANRLADLSGHLHRGYEVIDPFPQGLTGYEMFYTDMEGQWRKLYNPNPKAEELDNFVTDPTSPYLYWSKTVLDYPETLDFWIDFMDGTELAQYSIKAIGDRTKVVNDDKVTSIYFRDTPTIIFVNDINEYSEMLNKGLLKDGYSYIYLGKGFEEAFTISSQGKSSKDEINNLIYQFSYCIETTTIQAVPIYTLQPNTRIYVYDKDSGIDGEYIIKSLSIPLAHSGMMSIQATKVVDRIY